MKMLQAFSNTPRSLALGHTNLAHFCKALYFYLLGLRPTVIEPGCKYLSSHPQILNLETHQPTSGVIWNIFHG